MEHNIKREIVLEKGCKFVQLDGVLTIIDTSEKDAPSHNIRKCLRPIQNLDEKKLRELVTFSL